MSKPLQKQARVVFHKKTQQDKSLTTYESITILRNTFEEIKCFPRSPVPAQNCASSKRRISFTPKIKASRVLARTCFKTMKSFYKAMFDDYDV
jgi:hypothetical protein